MNLLRIGISTLLCFRTMTRSVPLRLAMLAAAWLPAMMAAAWLRGVENAAAASPEPANFYFSAGEDELSPTLRC